MKRQDLSISVDLPAKLFLIVKLLQSMNMNAQMRNRCSYNSLIHKHRCMFTVFNPPETKANASLCISCVCFLLSCMSLALGRGCSLTHTSHKHTLSLSRASLSVRKQNKTHPHYHTFLRSAFGKVKFYSNFIF